MSSSDKSVNILVTPYPVLALTSYDKRFLLSEYFLTSYCETILFSQSDLFPTKANLALG
jgi:hypothetical protein